MGCKWSGEVNTSGSRWMWISGCLLDRRSPCNSTFRVRSRSSRLGLRTFWFSRVTRRKEETRRRLLVMGWCVSGVSSREVFRSSGISGSWVLPQTGLKARFKNNTKIRIKTAGKSSYAKRKRTYRVNDSNRSSPANEIIFKSKNNLRRVKFKLSPFKHS